MKKHLFLLAVCLIMMSMTASAITINKAMLEHNGQVTLFDGDKMQDAVNAAVDGDIIYLSLGTFSAFNITKNIMVRGVGETSLIDGNVNISIPGALTLTSPVLEGLSVSGTVNVGSAVNNLILRKCKMGNFTISATIDDAVLDRCYVANTLTLSSYIQGMTVVNTKLYNIKANSGATSNTTFVNCNIWAIYAAYFSGTIINSIINKSLTNYGGYSSSDACLLSTILLNTLINTTSNLVSVGSSSVTQNCYFFNNNDYFDRLISSSCECTFPASLIQSNGYLGTDGTVVGIYGGDTPYTLVPSVPTVTDSSLNLDLDNKTLNVNLTVSPQ